MHAKSDKKEINIPALSCIAQISSSSEEFGIKLINAGILEVFTILVKKRCAAQIQQICLILANAVSEGSPVIESMLKYGIYNEIAKLMRDSNLEIVKEALFIAQNSYYTANSKQLKDLTPKGLLQLIIEKLEIKEAMLQINILMFLIALTKKIKDFYDDELIQMLLTTLNENKGMEKIELLATHYNKEIADLAEKVIKYEFELYNKTNENHMIN